MKFAPKKKKHKIMQKILFLKGSFNDTLFLAISNFSVIFFLLYKVRKLHF